MTADQSAGAGPAPSSAFSQSVERWFESRAKLILAAVSAFVVATSFGWWNDIPPLGHDASGHIVAMARVAEAVSTRATWWAPDYNLGFPLGLYY
ncbi:MAG: hypothetical protein KC561_18180, partial [Myxococcales bacterium]|nr:hypothetical protein [Myxococcales bacterium]